MRLYPLPAGLGLVILLTACGSSTDPSFPAGDIAIVSGAVTQGTRGFSPNPLRRMISGGTRVTWINRDYPTFGAATWAGTFHRLVSDQGLFDSGDLGPNITFSFTFPGPGTYGYRCLRHPTMVGTITIAP